jgi:predicted nuclease of predicted toxin-antitoxin system
MSNTIVNIQEVQTRLHSLITPFINDLTLKGYKIIDKNRKILNVQDGSYLVIDGSNAYFYNINTSKVTLYSINDLAVTVPLNANIVTYNIIEEVWNHNFVDATDLIILDKGKLQEFNVVIKDIDFVQAEIDKRILENPTQVTQVKVKGIDYTLFRYAKI